jgi:ABC-type antimicrobial peptide transport system permease subunit
MTWMTIVGVARDIRMHDPTTPPEPQLYMPYLQHPYKGSAMRVLVKTPLELSAMYPTLQKMVNELNADVPTRFTTLDAMLASSISTSRFRATLIGLFAGLALCLAMAGVYGVMVYEVSQRSSEIGVRMALGGQPKDILRLVLARGLGLSLIGLAAGIAGALWATQLLGGFLYGTQANDPATFATVCGLLGGVSLLACYVPARRAMRVDPMVVLRYE